MLSSNLTNVEPNTSGAENINQRIPDEGEDEETAETIINSVAKKE